MSYRNILPDGCKVELSDNKVRSEKIEDGPELV